MSANSVDLPSQLRTFLALHEIRDTRILVSVSGGPDSTALLRLLCDARDEFRLTLFIAHFNHGLRSESVVEARRVADLGKTLGVDAHIESLPVSDGDPAEASGIEERARTLRYAALDAMADRLACPLVAVGHSLDDQVETVLHRMLRGSGLRGLAGMRDARPLGNATLIRPLLKTRRSDIEDWLKACGQPWCEDASNRDPRFTRNRIRHELLPALRQSINPQADRHIADLAEHVREVLTFVEGQANLLRQSALFESQAALQKWDAVVLSASESFLRCEALRLEWRERRWRELGMTRSHWESLAAMCEATAPASLSLPESITASRRGNLLVIEQTK